MPERRPVGLAVSLAATVALAAWGLATSARADGASLELRQRTTPWNAGETIDAAAREPEQRFALRLGARLGEIVLHERWLDFRGQPIPPGRYGLVYALQPRLKEHAGVDDPRDFALVVPAELTGSDDWIAASRAISRTSHPAVLALAVWRGEGDAPAELHEESPERLVLFRAVAGTTIGFVVVGRAALPEL